MGLVDLSRRPQQPELTTMLCARIMPTLVPSARRCARQRTGSTRKREARPGVFFEQAHLDYKAH
jgi:hypothetical protein